MVPTKEQLVATWGDPTLRHNDKVVITKQIESTNRRNTKDYVEKNINTKGNQIEIIVILLAWRYSMNTPDKHFKARFSVPS